MAQQQNALRLADSWDSAISTRRHVAIGCEMADELRRLHAENEALKASQIDVKSAMLQAAAMEREACALLCDNLQDVPATEPRHCAQDIRARGTP